MALTNTIKNAINGFWVKRAEKEFDIHILNDTKVDSFVRSCVRAYEGMPYWIDDDEQIKTINVAASICSETARLVVMNIGVSVTGSARAEWIQKQMEAHKHDFRRWVEDGCACGEIAIKPNGDSIDVVLPDSFVITEENGTEIRGACFIDDYYNAHEDVWYSRMEYHRIAGGVYRITNRCYKGETRRELENRVNIEDTVWKGINDDVIIHNVDKMLFGLFRMPHNNNIDVRSNRALPLFSGAMTELEDLDVAYSRNAVELYDSKRTVIIDADRLLSTGSGVGAANRSVLSSALGLPKFVKAVDGTDGTGNYYHEINPTLQTESRIKGINSLLSQIGFKCGFSNGYFVLNQKTGMVTATQVESDDRRTIQLINDIREQFKAALTDVIDALSAFADAYGLSSSGKYEAAFDFADLTLNENEDKARWLGFVQQGWIPFWRYLVMFEGYAEDEAKEIDASQMNQDALTSLFGQAGAGALLQ